VMALGSLADRRAIPALVNLTSDPWLATEAARSLGRIGDVEGLEALRDMIGMPEEPRREAVRAAAQIVLQSGTEPPEWLRHALREEEDELLRSFGEAEEAGSARL